MTGNPWALTLAYMRVSTAKQDAVVQRDTLEQHHYDELFQEQISGTRDDRPEFERMVARALDLAKQGCAVTVLVLDDTRWARNVSVSLETIKRLELWGVSIRTTSGKELSVSTPDRFFQTGIDALLAEKFSHDQRLKASRSYQFRKKKKRPLGNRTPFGYRYTDDHSSLKPDPSEWEIARGVAERFLAGESNREIILYLKSQGIVRQEPWIRLWLKNPTIRGHLYQREKGRPNEPLREVIYALHAHPALITEAEYKQIALRLEQRKSLKGANTGAKIYPVPNSIMRCFCGRGACGHSIPRRPSRYYRCVDLGCEFRTPSTKEHIIEAAIQSEMFKKAELILNKSLAPEEAAESPRLIQAREQLAKLESLAADGVPGLDESIAKLGAEIQELTAPSAASRVEIPPEVIELFQSEIFWDVATDEQRREIYLEWVVRVVIHEGRVVDVVLRG